MIRIERFLINCLCMAILVCAWPMMSLAGAINLPQTGQTTCYDESGTIINCIGTGQDGEIQAGVSWPEPRFIDNGDGTITDLLNGLMWLKDGVCFGKIDWRSALDAVTNFNQNPSGYNCADYDQSNPSYNDWRLPNVVELSSLINWDTEINNGYPWWIVDQGFFLFGPNFWTSTSEAFYIYNNYADVVDIVNGYSFLKEKKSFLADVLAVRSTTSLPAQLWKTGQSTCYNASGTIINCIGTGQDGEIQAGGAWPEPRFIDNGNGTITDKLTDLMWLKDANCFGYMTWQIALNTVNNFNITPEMYNCIDYDESNAPYNDWRLPNIKELESKTDYSKYGLSIPSPNPFVNTYGVQWYWSSSNHFNPIYARIFDAWYGNSFGRSKTSNGNVWPVRGGQVGSFDQLATITQKIDLNGDGVVDGADLAIFLTSFGSNFGDQNYDLNADFDNDGDVDQDDLKLFSIIFGNLDLPIILTDVPVLDQNHYTKQEYISTYVESVGDIRAGGCVPVSFAMLFLGHYNYFGPTFPILDLSYNSQNIKNLMDDIATRLSVPIPVSKWREFFSWGPDQTRITELEIFENMENYSFVFDSDDYTVEASWSIDYECGTVFSNHQLVKSIVARLNNAEPIFFIGNIKFLHDGRSGGHASIVSGYAKFGGIEYFRVNDTYSHIPQWYEIERGSVCVVNDNCSPNFCPVKLISLDGKKVLTMQYSIAWPQHLNILVVPKY